MTYNDIKGRVDSAPDFKPFATAVNKRFMELAGSANLFLVDVDPDKLWSFYLDEAIPEEANPIFRERRFYDCSSDRAFVRRIGPVVSVNRTDMTISTVWDIEEDGVDPLFVGVAAKMSAYVRSMPLGNLFCVSEKHARVSHATLYETIPGTNDAISWNNFHAVVPAKYLSSYSGDVIGAYMSKLGVFKRGLETITNESLASVRELIDSNSLYRGSEFKERIRSFAATKAEYDKLPDDKKDAFIYAVTRADDIRNTVIGSLLVDLSEGKDIEKAVSSFESKVAPHNYKRPKPLITEAMKKAALKDISELGLADSLERRHAKLTDISPVDVLWTNASARSQMKPSKLETLLDDSVKRKSNPAKGNTEVPLDKFLASILPGAKTLELRMENNDLSHLMTLTAPVHPDAKGLFKWDNNFSWSYNGDVADSSIAETVRKYGGKTDRAALRVSLAWFNGDDLDLHCETPEGRSIDYVNRCGVLDLDMNGTDKHSSTDPVENMIFDKLVDGRYTFHVHQYYERTAGQDAIKTAGFKLEVAYGDHTETFTYPHVVDQNEKVGYIHITVGNGKVVSVTPKKDDALVFDNAPRNVWGIQTQTYVPVSTLMFSPNHWGDNETGNKHLFFMLAGCRNPDPVRGLYNEYLKAEYVEKHRRVFEVLASKTKADYTDDQLSGFGVSLTKHKKVSVKVDNRPYTICL